MNMTMQLTCKDIISRGTEKGKEKCLIDLTELTSRLLLLHKKEKIRSLKARHLTTHHSYAESSLPLQ